MSKLFPGFLSLFLILSAGCVPRSHIKKAEDKAFKQADVECIAIQNKIGKYVEKLEADLKRKNTRLRKFNQVDQAGDLYSSPAAAARRLKDRQNRGGPTGGESWQK